MLDVAHDGDIAVLTLDRPAVRNAVDAALAAELDRALTAADTDPRVRAVVLAGRGPAFCAGQDLRALAAGEDEAFVADRGWAGFTARERDTPVVAAVDGPAVGGGFELVLACDLVVASSRARFALPEVRHGLLAAAGGAARLPHRLPAAVAVELLLTGGSLPAGRAAELGLVNRLVEPGQALGAAVALAREVAAQPGAAVTAALAVARCSQVEGERAADLLAARLLARLRDDAGTRARVAAFGRP